MTPTNSVTNTVVNTATSTSTSTPPPNTATNTPTNTATKTSTAVFTATPTSTLTTTPTPIHGVSYAGPYPNPVTNGPIKVDVTSPGSATIQMDVFTMAFRKIAEQTTLASAASPGFGTVTTLEWNLKDRSGAPAADGLYYLRIQVHGTQESTKILKVLILK